MTTRPKISLPAPKADSSAIKKNRPPVRGAGSAPRDRRPRPPAPLEASNEPATPAAGERPAPSSGPQGRRPPPDARPAPRAARPVPPRDGRQAGPRRDESRPFPRDERQPPRQDRRAAPRGDEQRAPYFEDRRPRREERAPAAPDRPPRRFGPEAPPLAAQTPSPPSPPAEGVRLSKRMSELGLASRREADEWIEQGWVLVDGQIVSELGSRVRPEQQITIDPQARQQQAQRVTVLIHKPIGYVSGQAEDGYEPAVVLVRRENQWSGDRSGLKLAPGHLRHLAPAGRLDIDSTGLLVLTQDGRVARKLIGEDSEIEKEYLVRVRWADASRAHELPLSQTFPAEKLELLRHGLSLDGQPLRPARVSWQNEEQLRFVLREGKKRQIRRMCELVGLEVTGLKRIRMGRIVLGDLPVGQWRFLRADERF